MRRLGSQEGDSDSREQFMETTAYKVLLGEKLTETDGRTMYTADEVRDILLDLWSALKEEVPDGIPAPVG